MIQEHKQRRENRDSFSFLTLSRRACRACRYEGIPDAAGAKKALPAWLFFLMAAPSAFDLLATYLSTFGLM